MKRTFAARPLLAWAVICAITLLAFVLRVYHIGGQSLWYDEGFSVYLAQMSVADITARTAADIQPPVYYYLLHAWMLLFGHSETAVRLLSVVFGVLTIPLVYLLVRRLLNPALGLLAALLLAVSPFHVWYAQEARMYTLVTMLGVVSSCLLVVVLDRSAGHDARWSGAGSARHAGATDGDAGKDDRATGGTNGLWVLYALTNVAAIYTHYYAFFLVAAQSLYLAVWWLRNGRRRSVLLAGLAAQAATVVAYLPWAGFALHRLAVDESYWEGALSLDFVRKTLLSFASGQTVYEAQAQIITIGYLVLLAVGAVALLLRSAPTPQQGDSPASHASLVQGEGAGVGSRQGNAEAWLFLVLYLVVPFVLLFALSAWRPKFNPRYLMLASPPFVVLIAVAVQRLWAARQALLRALAVAGLLFVLGTSAYALANNYTNRVYVRDDFRSVAARIAAGIAPDEAIILCSGHLFPVFNYYYADGAVYRIPDLETLSTRAIVTYDVADQLNQIAAVYRGLWVVLWQDSIVDPNGILSGMLDAQAERVAEDGNYWGIELRHYRLPVGATFARPQIMNPLQVNFDEKITLLGYNVPSAVVPSGEILPLTLFWQARQPMDEDGWLSLRLLDPAGHIVGRLDQRPANYTYPTSRWQPGVTIPGAARLLVLAGTPPGDYSLQASIFVPARGLNLDVLDERGAASGVSAVLGTIRVGAPTAPPAVESLGLERTLRLALGGGIEALATNLGDRGVRQGEVVHFDIAWRNSDRMSQDYQLRLALVAADGKSVQETKLPLTATPYPTTAWPAGSIIRGQYDLLIPADAPAQVSVEVGIDGAGSMQTLARLTVAPVARVTEAPAIAYTQTATFGAVATLLGYDLAPVTVRPGQTVNLTLYWQAGTGASEGHSYTVFTHLLGSGLVYGQHDGVPGDGVRPTTGWVAGEIVIDRHLLVVKPDAPPGEYVLEIGLYEPASDHRLEATADGAHSDHLILTTTVRVER